MAKTKVRAGLRPKLISLAVASCFAAGTALANPTGANVVRGTAAIHQTGNLLQITNSPNAIINWQSFSIGANEITRFLQQSASSAVLNRVTTQNPSQILGALQSNGRVFLINPNGILFGAGAQVDVAGLIASTLNMSDQDFLAGRLRFTDGLGKSVVNDGSIATGAGGSVYLIGSGVTNNGIIRSPQGEVVLAAGNSVELVSPGTPNLRVEIAALDNEARNLGQIISDAGRIGIYAGLINNSGSIRADSAVSEGGRIVLKASKNTTLEAGSVTSASGQAGGSVTVQSGDTTLVAGAVEAIGADGAGGGVQILGNLVGLVGNASVDASGDAGGGTVLVGGDFQGKNPEVQNAFRTYFGPDATIKADAITSGDGGKVIVWSDDATRAYGTISARGGAQSGNGGFVEVSGKRYLDYRGRTIASAANGNRGTLLLDPSNITIDNGDPALDTGGFDGDLFHLDGSAGPARISWTTIKNNLTSANASIWTSQGSGAQDAGDITIAADSPDLATSGYLQLKADNKIFVNARITNTGTGPLLLESINGVEQNANGAITYNQLYVNGGNGNVMLNTADNMVNVITGHAAQEFRFRNAQSLEIGSISIPVIQFQSSGISVSDCCSANTVEVTVTSGNLTITENVTANSSSSSGAVILTASTGNILVQGISAGSPTFVTADGAEGASINLMAAGDITVHSGRLRANGSQFGSTGANASIGLVASGGNITVDGGEGLFALGGGTNGQIGGDAGVSLAAAGTFSLQGATVEATGGAGAANGGQANIEVNASQITVSSATILARGGPGPNCDCNTPDAGGGAAISLIASGTVDLASSTISAAGGFAFGIGGNASVTLSGANILMSANTLTAVGGSGFSGGVGGNANVSVTGGTIQLNGGGLTAAGGAASSGTGGNASVLVNAGGSLTVNGGVGAIGGAGTTSEGSMVGSGGSAVVTLNGNGIAVGGLVIAQGGSGNIGGAASTTLNGGAGGIAVVQSGGGGRGLVSEVGPGKTIGLATGVVAAGGSGDEAGGAAIVVLNTTGGISVNNTVVGAAGGSALSGIGGNAQATLTSGGNITLASNVIAQAGLGGAGNGTGRIDLIFLNSSSDFVVNGQAGLIFDAITGSGFMVNGAAAILDTNLFVTKGAPTFNDTLVATMNQQVDVLADQLKAGDTGEDKDKDKKKLPFCSS